MEFLLPFFLILIIAIGLLIYSIVGLVRTPKEEQKKRLNHKIGLIISIIILIIYALIFLGLYYIAIEIAAHGM